MSRTRPLSLTAVRRAATLDRPVGSPPPTSRRPSVPRTPPSCEAPRAGERTSPRAGAEGARERGNSPLAAQRRLRISGGPTSPGRAAVDGLPQRSPGGAPSGRGIGARRSAPLTSRSRGGDEACAAVDCAGSGAQSLDGGSAPGASATAEATAWAIVPFEAEGDHNGRAGGCGGVTRAKICVCGASSRLSRERSRLLKAERLLQQRLRKLADRDAAIEAIQEELEAREDEHRSRLASLGRSEAEAATKAQLVESTEEEAANREQALRQREDALSLRERELVARQQRGRIRAERASTALQDMAADRHEVVESLRAAVATEVAAVDAARRAAHEADLELTRRNDSLARLDNDVSRQRDDIRQRHEEMEPLQNVLQAKEADLNEHSSLLVRRAAALEERERRLEVLRAESDSASAKGEALERIAEDLERKLAVLWDDVHQRSLVLEDIDMSLRGREERLDAEQRAFAYAREASAAAGACGGGDTWDRWPAASPEAEHEQTRLELVAAEIAGRAWRERSAALAATMSDLQERLRLLEA